MGEHVVTATSGTDPQGIQMKNLDGNYHVPGNQSCGVLGVHDSLDVAWNKSLLKPGRQKRMGSYITKNDVLGEAGQSRETLRIWKKTQELRWIMSRGIRGQILSWSEMRAAPRVQGSHAGKCGRKCQGKGTARWEALGY